MPNPTETLRNLPSSLKTALGVDVLESICKNEAAAWGIATSIAQFTAVTAHAEEETRTAALWGFIVSGMDHFNWLMKLANPSSEERDFHWYAAKKRSTDNGPAEDKHGGDFGVAVHLAGELYRVSFFQAKREKTKLSSGGESQAIADVSQGPSNNQCANSAKKLAEKGKLAEIIEKLTPTVKSEYASNHDKLLSYLADYRLKKWIRDATIEQFDKDEVNYQLLKLASTQAHGNKTREPSQLLPANWCHYVIWSKHSPTCFTLNELRTWVNDEYTRQKRKAKQHYNTKAEEYNRLIKEKAKQKDISNAKGEVDKADEEMKKINRLWLLDSIRTSQPENISCVNLSTKSFAHHLANGLSPNGAHDLDDGWITIEKKVLDKLIGTFESNETKWYVATQSNEEPSHDLGLVSIEALDTPTSNMINKLKIDGETSRISKSHTNNEFKNS